MNNVAHVDGRVRPSLSAFTRISGTDQRGIPCTHLHRDARASCAKEMDMAQKTKLRICVYVFRRRRPLSKVIALGGLLKYMCVWVRISSSVSGGNLFSVPYRHWSYNTRCDVIRVHGHAQSYNRAPHMRDSISTHTATHTYYTTTIHCTDAQMRR